MLYLLLDHIVDDYEVSHEILKIGYSEKKFSDSREGQYNTCNYGYKLIREIEGTMKDETNLHKKYKHLLLPNSREWFEYSDDIVNEFYPGFKAGDDITKSLEAISPITLKGLEKKYISDIIDPDYLLGTIKSIYLRINGTIDAVRYIWKKLVIDGESVEEVENYIQEKIKRTESAIVCYETARDVVNKEHPGSSIAVAEKMKRSQDINFLWDYIFVEGDEPNYNVKFNTGRLKIDQLALEAYKKELEIRKL